MQHRVTVLGNENEKEDCIKSLNLSNLSDGGRYLPRSFGYLAVRNCVNIHTCEPRNGLQSMVLSRVKASEEAPGVLHSVRAVGMINRSTQGIR